MNKNTNNMTSPKEQKEIYIPLNEIASDDDMALGASASPTECDSTNNVSSSSAAQAIPLPMFESENTAFKSSSLYTGKGHIKSFVFVEKI